MTGICMYRISIDIVYFLRGSKVLTKLKAPLILCFLAALFIYFFSFINNTSD